MSPGAADDLLIEATLTARRTIDADGFPLAPPEWWDLSAEARIRAYEAQMQARRIESALDDRGWSNTVHAVMARITGS